MSKKLAAGVAVGALLAGGQIPACSGMWYSGGITPLWPTLTPTPVTPTPTPDPTVPAPEPEPPPPPPPPVFVQADPQSFDLWDARENVATPEEAAPIQMEECVVIS